jgi:hypothetical protein
MMQSEAVRIHKNGHEYIKCEGCSILRRRVGFSWGHWLCRKCDKRKNFPVVGYKSKIVWQHEKKVLNSRQPYLSYQDCGILWKEYMKKGLTKEEAKFRIRSLKSKVRWAHRKYVIEEQ